jgi:hypothetical protein
MNFLIKTGRAFYSLALIVYGIQQFYFGNFRNVFFSPYQDRLPFLNILAYLFGLYLLVSGVLIFNAKRAKKVSLLLGGVFLVLFLSTQLTYELISEPNKIYHLGLWADPLKEVALCGGAFVVAGSFQDDGVARGVYRFLNSVTPYGNLFFLFTMTSFGIAHLIYGPYLVNDVPAWWPDHLFWVYFTGVALTGAGVAIILGIRIRVVSLLLALMTFLWFWMVHIPGGVTHPVFNRGDLLASAFDALSFSGISLIIALTMQEQKWISNIENLNR